MLPVLWLREAALSSKLVSKAPLRKGVIRGIKQMLDRGQTFRLYSKMCGEMWSLLVQAFRSGLPMHL